MGVANVQGEDQKKLDVLANDLFINMLKSSFEVSLHTQTGHLNVFLFEVPSILGALIRGVPLHMYVPLQVCCVYTCRSV